MGANCCVAARNKSSPNRVGCEVSTHRNLRHSPSWSFRWDNRTHIEDIMDNTARFSYHNSGNIGSEIKSGADTETEGLSDGGSLPDVFHTPKLWKSPARTGISGSSKPIVADQSLGGNSSPKENGSNKLSETKTSTSSSKAAEPSSSRSRSLPSDPTSSRKARRSPGYQLSRQISDSRIPSLKSLNESSNCSPEGRQSFVLSCGSSDGWSMRTFSELVAASSRRDRWSFDSENPSSINTKTKSSVTSSPDSQTCGICLKLLKEKSPWSIQKIVSTNDLSVAAVLVCGHVYHAECLESMTVETDCFDPPCPVCHGEKSRHKKGRNKISRIAVADIDVNGNSITECQKMGASSSVKGSFGRPFLMRHFSIGSRSMESDGARKKKGFWAWYRKD